MAAAYKIETGIPMPHRNAGPGATPKYPWASMEIGQSFFVSNPPKYFQSMVGHAGRLHKRKFTYRKMEDGVRVWRVA
jgi:hypothetical protein